MPISYRDLMLATPAPAPFSRPAWLFELKYELVVLNTQGQAVCELLRRVLRG